MSDCWQAWFDGSALPNPGKMGVGLVLLAPDGSQCERAFVAREPGCNNEAELNALCALLELARDKGVRHLQIYGDSDVAVKYVAGIKSTEIERLRKLVERSQILLGNFESVSLSWVPRHRNSAADALSRGALGLPPKPPPQRGRKGRKQKARE
ncbi:MAG: ribonuclease HI family protein [Rhodocyclaceae bacterium]|nr:ribonuclease HI family protein [Rhodocyclaceae bacterium]